MRKLRAKEPLAVVSLSSFISVLLLTKTRRRPDATGIGKFVQAWLSSTEYESMERGMGLEV